MKTKSFAAAIALASVAALNLQLSPAHAQGTAFTYQGQLTDHGAPANGSYDFEFLLYPTNQSGFPVGPVPFTNLIVNNGFFAATLDFGPGLFTGTNYWLDIYVRTNGAASFTELSPRQPITPTPYAIFAENVSGGGLTAGAYSNAVTFDNAANSFSGAFAGNGAGISNVNAATLGGLSSSSFWQVGGNAGTSDDFIGTVDNTTFNIRVNNVRVMRYRLATDAEGIYSNAPNVIGGSSVNSASTTVVGATIAGGGGNLSYDGTAENNKVTANFGTVGGGENNTVGGDYATIAGGRNNTASDEGATVCGGEDNTASGFSAVVCGGFDSTASGDYSMVLGGEYNVAAGGFSFAGGYSAQANHEGSFVWSGNNFYPFASTAANQFRVRATGGVAFVTAIDTSSGDATAGVHLSSGDTAWSSISDKNAKKNFLPVDGEAILEKLAAIPVEQWNYKWEPDTNTPHIGPMAQDFKGAFYPGRDNKSITTLEFDGVELAAIQGLNQKLNEKDARISALEKELSELKAAVEKLADKKD